MKKFTKSIPKKYVLYFSSILLLVTGFVSCKKDTTSINVSTLRVINASPSSATYNVYLNGSQINMAELPLGGTISYLQKETGSYSLKFTTGSNLDNLLTKTLTLNSNAYQSFYLINKPGELDGFLVSDDLSLPDETKSYIRFINLSPDVAALDLAKTDATNSLITNKAYKAVSGFISIDPGPYSFDARETATKLPIANLGSATFVAGYHYDIICLGLVNPANDNERGLSLQSILIH